MIRKRCSRWNIIAKLPADSESRELLVLDPMLATGGSASAAITFLKQRNCKAHPSGQPDCRAGGHRARAKDHPDVNIYVAACDEKLNEHGYIVPGLVMRATVCSEPSKPDKGKQPREAFECLPRLFL